MEKRTEREEVTCKVQKIDSRRWRFEAPDPLGSLVAEFNLKDGQFDFEYKVQNQQKEQGKPTPEPTDSVHVGFDRQTKQLDLEYKGKDGNNIHEVKVKIPIPSTQVSVETKDIIEKKRSS